MIYRKAEEVVREEKPNLFDGKGAVTMVKLLEPAEMLGKGRLFNRVILPVGASIGLHQHDGEEEFYYILQGEGNYYHDDEVLPVTAGDVVNVDNHHKHGIENTGDDTLEFIALILFAEDHE